MSGMGHAVSVVDATPALSTYNAGRDDLVTDGPSWSPKHASSRVANMTHSNDVVVCGTCVADVLVRPVPLESPVGAGRLFHVDPIEVTTGGIVCNTGLALRRLGASVQAAAVVGEDLWAGEIRSRLAKAGVGTTAVESQPGAGTSTTAALIDADGERSFAHHVGAAGLLDVAFLRRHEAMFARSRFAVLGYVGLLPAIEPRLAEAVAVLRATGCRVVLETGGSGGSLADIAPALQGVDVFVPSLEEARQLTGMSDPREIIGCYRRLGAAGLVGVKCGSQGSVISAEPGHVIDVPCLPAPGPVVDTTGAGDSFLAGLVVGLCRQMPVAAAARLGAATAACCVTRLGATAGIRDLAATLLLAGL
ncbi:MAG: carbohydrate kinase family protein [Planctomycetes bacterium]|nr:carbohydrate kinase family protein [Planctomycetota bacterium]